MAVGGKLCLKNVQSQAAFTTTEKCEQQETSKREDEVARVFTGAKSTYRYRNGSFQMRDMLEHALKIQISRYVTLYRLVRFTGSWEDCCACSKKTVDVCTHIYIKILSQLITSVALFTPTCFDPYGSSSESPSGPCQVAD